MLDISDAQERFSSLIESRSNARTSTPSFSIAINSPLRSIGESLLNKFAYQISSQANIAEQKEKIADEILENIVSSLALAGMIGINLEEELSSLLNLLEAVSGEAS